MQLGDCAVAKVAAIVTSSTQIHRSNPFPFYCCTPKLGEVYFAKGTGMNIISTRKLLTEGERGRVNQV